MTSQNRGSGIRTFQTPNFVGPVLVNHNIFSNDYHGVRVANDGPLPADVTSGNLHVNQNAFTTDTSEGISVASGTVGTVNGICNWWGPRTVRARSGPAPVRRSRVK